MKNVIAFLTFTLIIAGSYMSGCSEQEDITAIYKERPYEPLTYNTDIKPFVDVNCAAVCHSAATHYGNYDMSTYAGVLGNGSDGTPNAIAGNPSSLLITKLAEGHAGVSQPNQDLIYQWVVVDSLEEN